MTQRFYPTPLRMTIIKKTNSDKLVRIGGKDTLPLLVGMEISAATMEISMEAP
jgi:hypothetical protein